MQAGTLGGFDRSSQHLDMEVVRWVLGSVSRRSVRCAARCGRRGDPRRRGVRIGFVSGRRSPVVPRLRMRRSRRGSRRRSGRGGFVRVAGCRRSAWPRSRGGICRLLSVRTSPSCMPNRSGFRQIARRLGRDPSTISRELWRNASTRTYRLEYRACTGQWHAERRASRPKVSKLAANEQL